MRDRYINVGWNELTLTQEIPVIKETRIVCNGCINEGQNALALPQDGMETKDQHNSKMTMAFLEKYGENE